MNGVSPPEGFRVYSAFTTFAYSQLQFILSDSFLGDISHWDHFMSVDLSSPDLPIKSVADFMQNKDFAKLVAESDLPTPTRFVEQALCFYKNLCILLLKHKVSKSKLVRGFSVFDEAVIRYGEEVDYVHESELLCDYLVQQKWISHTTKPLVLSEYGAFVEKFRSHSISYEGGWISFMSNHNELQCRENLFTVFKLCTLSLSGVHVIPSVITIELPELASDSREFQSCVRSIQSSSVGVPNVSELYANPRTVSSVLLGRALLEDAYLSVWDLTSSCSSRFDVYLTISILGKLVVFLTKRNLGLRFMISRNQLVQAPFNLLRPLSLPNLLLLLQFRAGQSQLGQKAKSPEHLLCLQHLPFQAHVIEWTCQSCPSPSPLGSRS